MDGYLQIRQYAFRPWFGKPIILRAIYYTRAGFKAIVAVDGAR